MPPRSVASGLKGKTKRKSFYESFNEPSSSIGDKVYVDLLPLERCKDSSAYGHGGYTQMLISVDSHSNMLHVYPMSSKNDYDIQEAFIFVLGQYKRFGHTVKEIHCDSESCFKAADFWLAHQGLKLKLSPPSQHCQRIERMVQTVLRRTECIRHGSPVVIPPVLEGELVRAAVYLINDVPNTKFPTRTPREMFEGVKLNIEKRLMLPIGTVAMNLTPESKEQRARLGIVLGPTPLSDNCVQFWHTDTNRIVSTARVEAL